MTGAVDLRWEQSGRWDGRVLTERIRVHQGSPLHTMFHLNPKLRTLVANFSDGQESRWDRIYDHDVEVQSREESEPCERGTVGCSIFHEGDEPCETY